MSLHAPVTVPPNYSTTALPPHPHLHAHSQAQEESPSLRYTSLYIGATGGVREKMTQGQMGDLELDQMRTGFERAFASDGASDFMATVKFEGRSSPLICLPLSLPLPATRNAMPRLALPCHTIPYHTSRSPSRAQTNVGTRFTSPSCSTLGRTGGDVGARGRRDHMGRIAQVLSSCCSSG